MKILKKVLIIPKTKSFIENPVYCECLYPILSLQIQILCKTWNLRIWITLDSYNQKPENMDSSKISRAVIIGVIVLAAFVIVTKVLPTVLGIVGNIVSIVVSLAVVAFVGLGLIKILKYTVNK